MDLEHLSWRMFFIRLIELIFIVNIVLLDFLAFRSFHSYKASVSTLQTQQHVVSLTPTTDQQPTSVPSPTPIIQTTTITQSAGAKELYIPLGTGQTTNTDWENAPGVLAYIDSTKYTNLKTITFETSIHVPTANQTVWIRLYDMTDEHPVWYSEMNMTGSSQFIVSQPITLAAGNKLYQVQMKTQLQYPAILDQARIHITLN